MRDPYPSSPGSGLMKMELWIAVDMLMNLLANMFNYGISHEQGPKKQTGSNSANLDHNIRNHILTIY